MLVVVEISAAGSATSLPSFTALPVVVEFAEGRLRDQPDVQRVARRHDDAHLEMLCQRRVGIRRVLQIVPDAAYLAFGNEELGRGGLHARSVSSRAGCKLRKSNEALLP